ncbi:MAG: hypothetical protein J6D08_13300 [Lachnospiraceae bacterium]|nr:hypothetical protein [Lachnospiraceae bacterium]
MQEERVHRCYPWEERPDIILENDSSVQITAQIIRQKTQAAQIHCAVEGIQKMTESLFPQYRVSPVYICGKGKLPVGWFHMGMPDKGAEHIKAIGIMSDYMTMLAFTYPAEEAVKWKSIFRHSFGTWREYCGED